MNLNQLLKTRREEILEIAKNHGAHNLRLFGSVARGEATANSDVDILVEFEPHRSLLDHSRFVQDLEKLLNRKVDVVEPVALHWYIKDKILDEAVPI